MGKETDVTCVLLPLDIKVNTNDKSIYSIKTHIVLINKVFRS